MNSTQRVGIGPLEIVAIVVDDADDALEAAGVGITGEIRERPWGTDAMFANPFGNESGLFEYAGGCHRRKSR